MGDTQHPSKHDRHSSRVEALLQENRALKEALSLCSMPSGNQPSNNMSRVPTDKPNGKKAGDPNGWNYAQMDVSDPELRQTLRDLKRRLVEHRRIQTRLLQSDTRWERRSGHSLKRLEKFRKNLAWELRESIGASLSAIKYKLEEKQAMLEDTNVGPFLSLKPMIRHLAMAIKQAKYISGQLRPSTLDDLGLNSTLSLYCREFMALRKNIGVEYRIEIDEDKIPEDYKIVLYRMIHEAMTNAAEHGDPTSIQSVIDGDADQIRLTVQDNGGGYDPNIFSTKGSNTGNALQSIRERAESYGGSFEIETNSDWGTLLKVRLPRPEQTLALFDG